MLAFSGNHYKLFWNRRKSTLLFCGYDYLECLQKLVDYYNDDGRNLPIYIPTIGCGLARLGITIDDAIRQIMCIWKMNKKVIRNSVNIVVYKKNFWNVHIMDYK